MVKTDGLTIPFLDAEIVEDGDVEVNEIKFTKVDYQTTIYGGREANTFSLDGDANFEGTIIGGEGFRDWVGAPDTEGLTTGEKALEWAKFVFEKLETLHTLLGGELPDIFVSNKIDYTDATPFVASGDSAWEIAKSGLKSLFHSVRLREVGGEDIATSVTQQGWHGDDHSSQSLVLDSSVPIFQARKWRRGVKFDRSVRRGIRMRVTSVLRLRPLVSVWKLQRVAARRLVRGNWSTRAAETPQGLTVLAYSDVAGTEANLINEFGAIWSAPAPAPEIQSFYLDNASNATELALQIGSASVTWTDGGSGFGPRRFPYRQFDSKFTYLSDQWSRTGYRKRSRSRSLAFRIRRRRGRLAIDDRHRHGYCERDGGLGSRW